MLTRTAHRIAGATICRITGHRPCRYIWGACDRCCQFYRTPDPQEIRRILDRPA